MRRSNKKRKLCRKTYRRKVSRRKVSRRNYKKQRKKRTNKRQSGGMEDPLVVDSPTDWVGLALLNALSSGSGDEGGGGVIDINLPGCEILLEQCTQRSRDCFFQSAISVLYRGTNLLGGLHGKLDSVLECLNEINDMQCRLRSTPVILSEEATCMDLSSLSSKNQTLFREIYTEYLKSLKAGVAGIIVVTDIESGGTVHLEDGPGHSTPKFMAEGLDTDKFILSEGGVPHMFLESCFKCAFDPEVRTIIDPLTMPSLRAAKLLSIPYIKGEALNKLEYLITDPLYPFVICGCCLLDEHDQFNINKLPDALLDYIKTPPGYLLIGGCVLLVREKNKHAISYNLCNQANNYILCDSKFPNCINLNTEEITDRYSSPGSPRIVNKISFVFRRI